MACEVLTADVYTIIDKLTNNEVYYTMPCQSEFGLVFTESKFMYQRVKKQYQWSSQKTAPL